MKIKKFLALLLALSMILSFAACGGETIPTDIPNGDFEAEHELGKWNGWTREDAAFNVRGLVSDEKIQGAVMEKSGEFYFAGSIGGNPPHARHPDLRHLQAGRQRLHHLQDGRRQGQREGLC